MTAVHNAHYAHNASHQSNDGNCQNIHNPNVEQHFIAVFVQMVAHCAKAEDIEELKFKIFENILKM